MCESICSKVCQIITNKAIITVCYACKMLVIHDIKKMSISQNPDQPDHENLFPEEEDIQDYFVQGFDADDIPSLWGLKQKSQTLNAFTTIFRGEMTGIMVRLHILSEMSSRPADTASWGLSELRHNFAYLTDTAFDTVMRRLRGGGLIAYDREENSYSVTPLGLQVNSAITYLFKSYEDEGLGLLTGILYAGEAMSNLSKEELAHLLNRLGQLEQELLSAVDSASEPTIVKARERFEAIWKRIEQGTDIIRRIAEKGDMDRETHRLGQRVARAQSRLARVTSIFQRAMNDIDRQRMHLGSSGISTSDLNRYLMNRETDELIALLDGSIGITVQPVLLLSDLLADVAEGELFEKQREEEEFRLPEPVESPLEESIMEEDIPHLTELIKDVMDIEKESAPLKAVIPREGFEVSSYRLSMLSLTDSSSKDEGDGLVSELVNLPVELYIEDGAEEVMEHGVSTISKGDIKRKSL